MEDTRLTLLREGRRWCVRVAAVAACLSVVPRVALRPWRAERTDGPTETTPRLRPSTSDGSVLDRCRRLLDDPGTRLVVLLSAVLFVGFSVYLSFRYQTFYLFGGDFGDYVHLLTTTVHGTGFLQQAKFRAGLESYWGGHFAVTLLAVLPVFAVVQSPYTLLVVQSAVLAASVPALWVVARRHLADQRLAGLVVVSYALNPYLWSAWSIGFFEQAALPVLVFGTYHAYRRQAFGWFLVGVTLVALTNEFVVLLMAGFVLGLLVVSARRGRLRGEARALVLGLVVLVVVKIVSGVVIAHFNAAPGISLASIARPLYPFVEGPQTTTGALVAAVVANPGLLSTLFTLDLSAKVAGLFFLLLTVAFLAALDETSVLALAPFLVFGWLFAGKSGYYQFGGHYPLYVLPFVYVGTVRALDRLDPTIPSRDLLARTLLCVVVVSAGVGVVALQGPFGLRPVDTPGERERTVAAAIDAVPPEATLVTQNDLYPHVATRPTARYVAAPAQFERYQRQHGPVRPDYVLVDHHSTHWSNKLTEAFGDRLGTEYGRYRASDEVVLWKRGYDGPVEPLVDDASGDSE